MHPPCDDSSTPLGRYFVREQQETQVSQVELFLNSVPILASLSRDERLRLVDALEEVVFPQGSKVW
jgi:cGMP-dependent protein kinase 2